METKEHTLSEGVKVYLKYGRKIRVLEKEYWKNRQELFNSLSIKLEQDKELHPLISIIKRTNPEYLSFEFKKEESNRIIDYGKGHWFAFRREGESNNHSPFANFSLGIMTKRNKLEDENEFIEKLVTFLGGDIDKNAINFGGAITGSQKPQGWTLIIGFNEEFNNLTFEQMAEKSVKLLKSVINYLNKEYSSK